GAVERGAVAVVGEAAPGVLPGPLTTYVQVTDGRLALAHLAAAWHGYPSRRLKVIGVTGTDGKTTTSTLIQSILLAAGHPSGLVSTVSARIGDQELDTGFHTTTPDALDLQNYLACMVEAGMEYAVLETSSHGLEQQRAAAVDYDVAVLTNITHEHLDQHGNFEAYRQAKALLFRYLASSARKPGVDKISILNADDPSYPLLRQIPADDHLSYGLDVPAGVTAREVALTATGTRFTAVTPAGEFPVASPLLGRFNLYNLLAAIAVGVSQGLPAAGIQQGIAAVQGVVGRMESITLPGGPPGLPGVIVDFAHTPNALENALRFARTLTIGRLIAVFGCAGLRDRGKRPLMGEVAGRLADLTVITAEDPRTENLDEIMEQIAGGCRAAGRREGEGYILEGDRGAAIARAVALAAPGDLVMVCGKGHERSMCYGTTEHPWSDQDAVRKALAGL
ncbi:MAG: UDP-N-acetylmuramoyl-L-alanyl-D-glutamate--2,6-diaminopimelate ligase, partial [Chloroflexota bacterium]|nr:UDP-N-acetylmuramoyl-L-alanyl-D-glutamate--2,6-diaminopimelate ligase [Chloroflexota bacterium]